MHELMLLFQPEIQRNNCPNNYSSTDAIGITLDTGCLEGDCHRKKARCL